MKQLVQLAVAIGLLASTPIAHAAEPSKSATVKLPNGAELKQVDFGRHVLPLISRLGCNAAACHGSFQGRGGFRLSLFGHDQENDAAAIAQRADVTVPAESLILTKPTLLEGHEGGKLFEAGSWEYELLHTWIQTGAHYQPLASDGTKKLIAIPSRINFPATREAELLTVSVEGNPGEDVTPFCCFESREPGVVEVSPAGELRAIRPGATHVVATYAGSVVAIPVSVPFPRIVDRKTDEQSSGESNYIDSAINTHLQQLSLPVSPQSTDLQFLRRITLDTLGRLPTLEEAASFAGDPDLRKRDRLIDRLLADPQHASLWATRLCDLTGCRLDTLEGPERLKQVRAGMWHAWFRKRLLENAPFDQIARGVVLGASRDELDVTEYLDREIALLEEAEAGNFDSYAARPSLDLFWRRQTQDGVYPRQELGERIAAMFLGIQFNCARCHKHPHDRWTQHDYQSFVRLFDTVSFGSSIELNRSIFAKLQAQREDRAAGKPPQPLPRIQEVFDRRPTDREPADDLAVLKLLWDSNTPHQDELPRKAFADWLTAPENPYFAQNWVNRIWAHYFGRGLVDPVDGFAASNPATHPELLKKLSSEFAASGFDMRSIERVILKSQAYQRSSTPGEGLLESAKYYAAAAVRPLPAETTLQVLDQALGHSRRWKDESLTGNVWDLAADRPRDERLAYLLELFGRGTRKSVCDCDRSPEPTLRQTLHLMCDAKWLEELNHAPLLNELATTSHQDDALESLFLRTLSRLPSANERTTFLEAVRTSIDPAAGWADAVWALLNSQEFRTNH